MYQPRLGEPILQVGIDAPSAAEHQRIDERRAGAVELVTRATEDGPESGARTRVSPWRVRAADHEDPVRAPRDTGPRDPDRLDAIVEPGVDGGAGWPAGGHLAGTPGRERRHLDPPPDGVDRLGEANPQLHASRRKARGAPIPVRPQSQLAAGPAERRARGQEEQEWPPAQRARGQDQQGAERVPETQKAGRETGPVGDREQQARAAASPRPGEAQSCRVRPLAPQRGACEIFRRPSIIATSIAARLWSFSRLTSVITEPCRLAT